MKIAIDSILKLRLSAPSERYQRFARKGDAEAFAYNLSQIPGCGADVYRGGLRRTEGVVVTLKDDTDAALAAGAGHRLFSIRPERDRS